MQIFFAHRRLPMSKKILIIMTLRGFRLPWEPESEAGAAFRCVLGLNIPAKDFHQLPDLPKTDAATVLLDGFKWFKQRLGQQSRLDTRAVVLQINPDHRIHCNLDSDSGCTATGFSGVDEQIFQDLGNKFGVGPNGEIRRALQGNIQVGHFFGKPVAACLQQFAQLHRLKIGYHIFLEDG